MAANTSPIFEKGPNSSAVQILPADTTSKKSLVTGDATNGSRVDAINVTSTDTASVVLNVYITIGGTDYTRGSVTVAAGSGTLGAATVDLVPTLAATLGYIPLPASAVLKVAANATITTAKQVDIVASYGDY